MKSAHDPEQYHMVHRFAGQLEEFREIIKQNVADAHAATEKTVNKNAQPHAFAEGQRVYLKTRT